MNKFIVLGIAITIIFLLIGAIVFVALGGEGLIPPYDGNEPGNPDSGGGAGSDEVSVAIKFTTPNSLYSVPETGCPKGKYTSVYVEGQVYGLDVKDIKAVRIGWAGSNYNTRVLYDTNTEYFNRLDDYNIFFDADMWIQRLGQGDHLLKAEALDSNSNTIAEASIMITIPDYWVYKWDCREPVRDDAVWRGYDGGLYFYGFEFPYQDNQGTWQYLQGEILKVKGSLHVNLLCLCQYPSSNCNDLWFDIWNGNTQQWTTYNKNACPDIEGSYCGGDVDNTYFRLDGWYDVDIAVDGTWGNEIGFAGLDSPKGESWDDEIIGFVGEVWIEPGTINYNGSPLDFIMKLFSDNQQDPPHP